jgi:hypothetical protein
MNTFEAAPKMLESVDYPPTAIFPFGSSSSASIFVIPEADPRKAGNPLRKQF